MKNVWILNHYAQEPGGAGGTRHFHLAEHLQAYGWQATVIAASVDHQSGLQRLAPGELQRCDYFKGVPFLWVRTPEYRGNGGGRIGNMLAYTWRVLLEKTTRDLPRPDAVIGSSVHPFAAVAGALLARRFKVPFIFEVRDLWPQTLIDMGRLHDKAFLTWVLRKLELWLYRRAARTVVLLPRAWEYIVPLGIAKERIVWIPNGVDLTLFPRSPPPQRHGSEPFTLMYFGAHGQANGLHTVLQAMQVVQARQQAVPGARPIRLRLIGDGPLKATLMAQAQQLGLNNVCFEPPVPKNQIPALAAQADAFVIPIPDLPDLYRYGVSPNKLFDYFAAERPIVISASLVDNPVAEANSGLIVPPGDFSKIAEAVVEMSLLSPDELGNMGRLGREYVESKYDYQYLANKLAFELNSVVNGVSE